MKTFVLAALAAAALTGAAGSASAQTLNMNMGGLMANQARLQAYGDATAYNTANAYLRMMQNLRAQGYTGPSLPTGVTAQSLQNSINGANAASQRYIQGSQANSAARSNSVNDWGMRATRGCYAARDAYGNYGYVC